MSLYVGHLSPHVQPDELERVFRRFGRCSFQLKDGYGFVVYEVTANAERALRALRGKHVCGEQISLNWSNKQPRPFPRPTRGSRFDEPYRQKVFREEDNATGFRNLQDRRDFSMDAPFPAYNRGRRRVDGAPDNEAGHTDEDANSIRGKKGENLTDVQMDDENAGELNLLEHDRWGEHTSDVLPGHGVGKVSDFDRYEPYHGYNKRGEREGNQRGSSDSSPYRDLHGKGKHFNLDADRKFDNSIPHLTCYNCGQAGHIKRKCPEGDFRRDRFTKFDEMREEMSFRDKVEGRLKRFRANSWGRPSTSRDPLDLRHGTWEKKEIHSNNVGKSLRDKSSPERKVKEKEKEKHRSKLHSKSQTKKGSKKKYLSKKQAKKKRRISDTSSTSSDSSKSSSGNLKSRSISNTGSHSTSGSASSGSGSASSRSRSISISSYAKSKSSKSRSRSMSKPVSMSTLDRSLSLSISLGPKTSSSPKNKEIQNSMTTTSMKNSEHMESPESKYLSKLNNSGIKTLEDENALSSLGIKSLSNVENSGKNSGSGWKSDLEVGYNGTDACFGVINGAASASASENFPETSVCQGTHSVKPDKQLSESTRISTEEMLSALHHYGLVSSEADGQDVTVESYLGAARLWPWEMIYYRRLKRGPISTENYAKRLEQNKEFGIVDKYIRSSSGWVERQRDV